MPGKKPKARNRIFITSEVATHGFEVLKKEKEKKKRRKKSMQEKENVKGD